MPQATPLPYRAREVHRPALQGFDLDEFDRGLRRLYQSLPEDADAQQHTAGYVSLVLEVAQKARAKERDPEDKSYVSAREFAGYFVNRSPAYSNTRAGLSALMFETWLARSGGELYGLFLETVLESDSKYLAIFTGEVDENALKKIRTSIEEFASFEVAVRAGDRDYERGLVSEVTMLSCAAKGSLKDPAKQPEPVTGARTIESLRPTTRDDYARLVEQGGLSSGAYALIWGRGPAQDARFVENRIAIRDANGVLWEARDQATRWVPRLSTFAEPRSAPKPAPRPAVRERAPEPEVIADDPLPLFETANAGALRSTYGTWAVFEAPVTGGRSATTVVVGDRAWTVGDTLADVTEALNRIGTLYEGLDPEFDVMVEAFLAEFAEDQGEEVSNPTDLTFVLESAGSERAVRDRIVHAHNLQRLAEEGKPFPPAKDEKPTDDEEKDAADDEDGEEDEEGGEEDPTPPPPPPEPEAPSDRMDDPPFYRDDLQAFYDTQLTLGLSPSEAKDRTRQRFKVKGLVVTPAGEIRAPGVIDRPKSSQPPPPPPAAAAPSPAPEPEIAVGGPVSGQKPAPGNTGAPEAPQADQGAEEAATALPAATEALLRAWASEGAHGAPTAALRALARHTGRPEAQVEARWEAARGLSSRTPPGTAPTAEDAARLGQVVLGGLLAEAAPVEKQLGLQSLDDAFLFWSIYEDGDLDDFQDWLGQYCPHLVDALEVWQPDDAPIVEGRLQALEEAHAKRTGRRARDRGKRTLTNEQRELHARWTRLVNTPVSKLRRFLMSEAYKGAVRGAKADDLKLGLQASRRTISMRCTPVEEWTGEMWNWAGRQVRFISRLRGTSAPLIEQGRVTRKYLTLRAWGHDPAVTGVVTEAEVVLGQRSAATDVWRCTKCGEELTTDTFEVTESGWLHRMCGFSGSLRRPVEEGVRATNRLIDALPGQGPRMVEAESETPDFTVLKRNRQRLSDEERDAVMAAKAVWHPGNQDKPIPAVWKSTVGETTWYVTNTHRLFQARRSLDAAVSAFHRTVKATA